MKVYLDYGATSYKKPEVVFKAMSSFFYDNNTNPGRGGYELAIKSSKCVYQARASILKFFNGSLEDQVIFTKNITEAINIVIKGLAKKGDHFLISSIEHNSVYRTIDYLSKINLITYDIVEVLPSGEFSFKSLESKKRNNTKAFILNHVSNVSGHIMPIDNIGKYCKKNNILLVVDGAQSAGTLPVDFKNQSIDIFCFTGHKHLMGPMGTGGFLIKKLLGESMPPLIHGGTGSLSENAQMPNFLPDHFEAGTVNAVGIAGLGAAVEYLLDKNILQLKEKEENLHDRLYKGLLDSVPNIHFYGNMAAPKIGVISFNIENIDNGELANYLDEHFKIMARSGLHCSPLAHETFFDLRGSIRFSLGYYTTKEEIDYVLNCFDSLF